MSTGDHERSRRLFETATSWFVPLAWPTYLTIAIFSPVLLTVFGREFDAGAIVLAVLGAAGLFAAAAGPVDMLLLMAGRSTSSLFNNGAALVVNVVLNLILIPTIGMSGAALAWAASLVIRNALPLIQVRRQLDLHPFGHRWLVAVSYRRPRRRPALAGGPARPRRHHPRPGGGAAHRRRGLRGPAAPLPAGPGPRQLPGVAAVSAPGAGRYQPRPRRHRRDGCQLEE